MSLETAIREMESVHRADVIHEATSWINHIQIIHITLYMDDATKKMMVAGNDLEEDIKHCLRKHALKDVKIEE